MTVESGPPPRARAPAWGALALFCALAAGPSRALLHSVEDFSLDFSGAAADTLNLNRRWGDSLFLAPRAHNLVHVLTQVLNDSTFTNGASGASPVVVHAGDGLFKTAYLAWQDAHTFRAGGSIQPPRPDIVVKTLRMGEESYALENVASVLALQEVRDSSDPTAFYAGLNPRPPPSYFNYAVSGDKYAAYWGTLEILGPYRRTSHADTAISDKRRWARYVPAGAPIATWGYGKISAAARPGGGNLRMVLAYETNTGPPEAEVRWEDIDGGTTAAINFNRPSVPEDFAVGVDSAGNSLVVWRESDTLLAAAYDEGRAPLLGATRLETGIDRNDGVAEHYYRPYAVQFLRNGRFLLAYGKGGDILYRILDLGIPGQPQSLGPAQPLATGPDLQIWPDMARNDTVMLVSWYRRVSAADHRIEAARFSLDADALPDPSTRLDLDLAQDAVGFTEVGDSWYRWHYFKAPSVAIDDDGNIAVAYDDGFNAKLGLTWNRPLYHDSGLFVSRPLKVENPAVALVFDPASDSVEFLEVTADVHPPSLVSLFLATSADSVFDAGEGYRAADPPLTPFRSGGAFFRYRTVLRPLAPEKSLTGRLRSLAIRYNVRPRPPSIDSIRIGTGVYQDYAGGVYPLAARRDSLRLTLEAWDMDDGENLIFALDMAGRELARITGRQKPEPGRIRAEIALPPQDTVGEAIPFLLRARDDQGWWSGETVLLLDLVNYPPADSAVFLNPVYGETGGKYAPTGALDTLRGRDISVTMAEGDTGRVRLSFRDENDAGLTLRRFRNGVEQESRAIAAGQLLEFAVPADQAPGAEDTLVFRAVDPDDSIELRVRVRSNRIPAVDSVVTVDYFRESGREAGPFAKATPSDTGLWVPVGFRARLAAWASDPDAAGPGEAVLSWRVLRPEQGCASGDFFCYATAASAAGDTLDRTYEPGEEYLVLRATDAHGAFSELRLRLEFPRLDTAGNPEYRAALEILDDELDFVLDSEIRSREITLSSANLGNIPLSVHSLRTIRNVRRWMRLEARWPREGTSRSLRLDGRTDVSPLSPADPALVDPGGSLELEFTFFTDSLRGDSVLVDTLLMETNDPAQPLVRIPFRVTHRDLPLLRILAHPSAAPGEAPFERPRERFNDEALPEFIPARSSLVLNFTEPVATSGAADAFGVYSYLDSLANPAAWRPIAGSLEFFRRDAAPKASAGVRRGRMAAPGGAFADQMVFTPAYAVPSDSLGVIPPRGYFIQGDILRVRLANGMTDAAGNALDLRTRRQALDPGTFDTLFTVRVDTAVFRVVETVPRDGATGWDPGRPVEIRFNAAVALSGPLAGDNVTLDLEQAEGDSNRAIRITSTAVGGKRHDFRYIRLGRRDSLLTFQTFPYLGGLDTVTVRVDGSLFDAHGRSLDGNGDGLPAFLYDRSDTADAYVFSFVTGRQEFYLFPNPFRFADPRHRGKGSITFKNVHQLRGFREDKEVVLRVHSMTGDLLFSSRSRRGSGLNPRKGRMTQLDWDVRNDAGHHVATGVYLYTLLVDGGALLRKGKLAVIR